MKLREEIIKLTMDGIQWQDGLDAVSIIWHKVTSQDITAFVISVIDRLLNDKQDEQLREVLVAIHEHITEQINAIDERLGSDE